MTPARTVSGRQRGDFCFSRQTAHSDGDLAALGLRPEAGATLFSETHATLRSVAPRLERALVFVELPKLGAKVTATKTLSVVESVKGVSDFLAPLSGEVA